MCFVLFKLFTGESYISFIRFLYAAFNLIVFYSLRTKYLRMLLSYRCCVQ